MEYTTLDRHWEHEAGGPVSADIVCGDIDRDGKDEFIVVTDDSRIIGLSHEGRELFKSAFGGIPLLGRKMSRASPIIAEFPSGTTIIIGSPDHGLFAYDNSGKLRFSFTECGPVGSTPAVGDINGDGALEIVFGSSDGYLYALDTSGKLLFKKDIGYPIESRLTILPLRGTEHILFGSTDGRLHAIEGDGRTSWTFSAEGAIMGAPALLRRPDEGKDSIIFGSTDSFIYGIGTNGVLHWKHPAGGAILSDAVPYPLKSGAEGMVFGVCSREDNILALCGKDGQKEVFQANHWVAHAPAIGQDRSLVFGSYDHHLYVVSPEKRGGRKTLTYDTGAAVISRPAISREGMIVAANREGRIVCLRRESLPAGPNRQH